MKRCSVPVLDFVFIGPGRSGTTYMHSVIRQDARIALPQGIKETNHFLTGGKESEDRFWHYFPADCATRARRGEVANMYVYDPGAIPNLASMGAQLTLHTILRNPFDRLVSSLRFRLAAGEITHFAGFEDALNRYPDLVEQSAYATLLGPYMAQFGERLKVYAFDDLMSSPDSVVRQFYANIGLDAPHPIPLERVDRNIARTPRSRLLVRLGRLVSDSLRAVGMLRLLGRIKDSRLVSRLVYCEDPLRVEVSDWPAGVVARLNDEIDQLSRLLGRDFSHWKRPG
ncbi:hypothetical protein SAMN05216257_11311 [Meinhardsimonia xiamenensis]|uniref:Sulfotransferase domain-containing protein n=1 Tax=Meinhardsimonia xiamenensis TaxID=990712 RepID=A0A1G9HEN3_9RHOB|nr:hypothetical protein LV81_02992 [Meinhardsimonia xiamenensis]SDL11306.1 hypothetical protein SAMN05216257_11311 [Meinhardsimonia xiamenensis]